MSNKILFGDCYLLLKELESESIDLILTDPPYNISRESNFKNGSNNKKYNNISLEFGEWDKEEIDLDPLFSEFKRVLKKGGTCIIFYDVWKSNTIKLYAEKWKFKQLRICQWAKTNPVPINSKINYLSNAVEYFYTFVKGSKPTFNSEYDKGIYHYPLCHGKERLEHPTQKPLKLIDSLILKHSNIGDTILDPFAGSGTTAISCINNGRNFVMMENSQVFFEMIQKRVKQKN